MFAFTSLIFSLVIFICPVPWIITHVIFKRLLETVDTPCPQALTLGIYYIKNHILKVLYKGDLSLKSDIPD